MKTLTSRLLFIDEDGEFLQELYKAVPRGSSIETVKSVEQALQKLRACDFDVVGVELNTLDRAKENLFEWVRENHPLTVCILLTASSAVAAADAADKVGAFDYLIKPIEPAHVRYSLKRALGYRKLLLSQREFLSNFDKLNKQVGDRIRRATGELLDSNERLNAANRAKDQFLASMSHELRTPLTAITGAVRILQSPKTSEDKSHTILEILDRNVGTLKRLLDDLLDCSRIASGKLRVDLVPTNFVDSINAAVEIMRAKAAEAGVELQATVPVEQVIVSGNALRLQQIVWNLIDNAIKFTPSGGHIGVSLANDGDGVELMVSDSGAGIPEEAKDCIFEPFRQAHGVEAQRKGGLGLGLALVRNLTELHNGRVRVESEGLGLGSRFIVTLPLQARASPFQQAA